MIPGFLEGVAMGATTSMLLVCIGMLIYLRK